MQWNPDLLDQWLAPEISRFTRADIPDLGAEFPECAFWLRNNFLERVFGARVTGNWNKLALFFLQRVQSAFALYAAARSETLLYTTTSKPDSPQFAVYSSAIMNWESLILNIQMMFDCINRFEVVANSGAKVFERDDNSPEQRLYEMANTIKHLSGKIVKGEVCDPEISALWLNNDGLKAPGQWFVSYAEIATVLRSAGNMANELSGPLKPNHDDETQTSNPYPPALKKS